jgi:crotonobetainyl-CoA:carnitine CoA-transferase CaiB-like acyl-CoA transferase
MLHCPLLQVLRAPALATDARFASPTDRVRHRGELDALIAAEFSRCPRFRFSAPLFR